jgi:CheY-like chemotaxis protein
VDDDSDFRWATGNVLDAAGYQVIFAADGNEALSILEKNIPHKMRLCKITEISEDLL